MPNFHVRLSKVSFVSYNASREKNANFPAIEILFSNDLYNFFSILFIYFSYFCLYFDNVCYLANGILL